MDLLFPRDDRERLEFKESALQMGFEELTAECTASLSLLQSNDRLSVLIMAWKRIGEYLKHNQYSPSVSTVVNWVGRHTLELWFGRDWISCPSDNKSILIEYMVKVYPAAYISMCPYSWPYMFTIYRDPWMVDYLNINFQRMNDPELSEHLDSKDSDFILEEGLSLIFLRIVNMFDFNMMKLVKHMCRRLLLAWHDTSSIAHRSLRVAINASECIEYVRHMYLITFNEINGIKDLHYVLECVQRNMHCNAIECSHLDRAAQIIAEGLLECKKTLMEFLITFLSKVPDRQFTNTFGIAVNKYKTFLTEYLLKKIHTRRPVGCIGHMPADGIYEILVKMFIKKRESSEDLMKTTAAVSERLFAGVHDLKALKFSYDQIKTLTRVEWYTTKVTLLLGIISEELNSLEECKYTEGQTADELIRREQNLAIYYRDLSRLLGRTPALEQEAWLTAFSLHPCKQYFDAVTKCGSRNLRAIKKQAIKLKVIPEPKPFKPTNNPTGDRLSPNREKSSQNPVEDLSIAVENEEFPCPIFASSEPSCSFNVDTLATSKTVTGKSKRPPLSRKVTKTITKARPKSKSIEKQSVHAVARVTTPLPKKSLTDCRDKDTAEVLYAASAGAGDNVSLQTEETIKYPEFALVNSVTDTEDVIRYTDYDGDVLAQYRELTRLLSNIRLQNSNYDDLLALLIAPRYKRLTWATCWKNLRKRCRSLLTKDNKKKQLVEQCLADANERLTHLQIDYDKYKNKPQIDYGTIEGGYECFDTESGEEGALRTVVAGLKRVINRSNSRLTANEQHSFEEEDLSESQLAPESFELTTRIEEDSQASNSTLRAAPSDTVTIRVLESDENSKETSIVNFSNAQAVVNVPVSPIIQEPLNVEAASNVQARVNPSVQVSPSVQSSPRIQAIPSVDVSACVNITPNDREFLRIQSSPVALTSVTPSIQEVSSIQTFSTSNQVVVKIQAAPSIQASSNIQALLKPQSTSSDPKVKALPSLQETSSAPEASSDQAAPLQVTSKLLVASCVQASSSAQEEANIQADRKVQIAPIVRETSASQSALNSQALPSVEELANNPVTPSAQTSPSAIESSLGLEVEKSTSETFSVHVPKVPLKTYSRHRLGPSEKIVKLILGNELAASKSHAESTSKVTTTDKVVEKTSGTAANIDKSREKGALTNSSKATTSQGPSPSTEEQSFTHKTTQKSKDDMAHQWGNVSYPVDDSIAMDYAYEDSTEPPHYPPDHPLPCMHQTNQMIPPPGHSMAGTDAHSWNYLAHQQMCTDDHHDHHDHDWTETVNMPSIRHVPNQCITATALSPLSILTCPHARQPSSTYFDSQSQIESDPGIQIPSMYMSDDAMTGMYNHPHGARYFQYSQNREDQYHEQMRNIPNIQSHPHTHTCQSIQDSSSFTHPHCLNPTYGKNDYYMETSTCQAPQYQHGIPRTISQHSMSDLSAEPIMGNIQERTMSACTNVGQDFSMSDSEYIPFTGNEADANVLRARSRARSTPPQYPSEMSQSSGRSYVTVTGHLGMPTSVNYNHQHTLTSQSMPPFVSRGHSCDSSNQPSSSEKASDDVPLIDLRENFRNVQGLDCNAESILTAPRASTYTYFPPELNTVQIVKPSGTTRIAKMTAGMGQGIRRIIPTQRNDLLKIKPLHKFPNPRWRPIYNSIFKRKLIYVPTEAEVQIILMEYCGQRLNGRRATRLNICGLTEDNPGEEILDESVIINLTNPKYTNGDNSTMSTDRLVQNNQSKPELPGREAGVIYKFHKSPSVHFFLGIPTPAYQLSFVCPYDRQYRELHSNSSREVLTIEPNLIYKMFLFLKDDDFAWEKFSLTRFPSPPSPEDEEDDELDYVGVVGEEEKSDVANTTTKTTTTTPVDIKNQCHNENQSPRHTEAVSMRNSAPTLSGMNQTAKPIIEIEILSDSDDSPEHCAMFKSTMATAKLQISEITQSPCSKTKPHLEQHRKVKVCLGPQSQIAYNSIEPQRAEIAAQPRGKRTRKLVVRLERCSQTLMAAADVSNISDSRTPGKRSAEDSDSDSEISLRRSGRYALKVYGAGSRARVMENTNSRSRGTLPSTSYANQQQTGYPDTRRLNNLNQSSAIDSELVCMSSAPTFEEISSDE